MRGLRSSIYVVLAAVAALFGMGGAARAEVYTVETRIVSYKSANEKLGDMSQYNLADAKAVSELAARNLAAFEKSEKPQFDVEVALQVDERTPQAFRVKSQGYIIGGIVMLRRERDGSLSMRLDRVYYTREDKSKPHSTLTTGVELPCTAGSPAALQLAGMTSHATGRWGRTTTIVEAVFTTVRVSRDRLEPREIADPRSAAQRFEATTAPMADRPRFSPSR
jgi:hypothetical protein